MLPSHVPASASPCPSSPSRALRRDVAAVELEDRVGVAAVRDVAVAGVHGESRGVEVDEERRLPRLRGREQDDEVRLSGVADEVLRPADPPPVAVTHRARAHRPQVGPGVRLGQCQAVAPLAAHGRVEVLLPLLLGAGEQDVRGPADAGVQGVAGPPELLLHEHVRHGVEAGAADLLGHRGGVEPGRDRTLLDPLGELWPHLAGALDLLLVRQQLAFDERARHVDEATLLLGEGEVHHRTSRSVLNRGSVCLNRRSVSTRPSVARVSWDPPADPRVRRVMKRRPPPRHRPRGRGRRRVRADRDDASAPRSAAPDRCATSPWATRTPRPRAWSRSTRRRRQCLRSTSNYPHVIAGGPAPR